MVGVGSGQQLCCCLCTLTMKLSENLIGKQLKEAGNFCNKLSFRKPSVKLARRVSIVLSLSTVSGWNGTSPSSMLGVWFLSRELLNIIQGADSCRWDIHVVWNQKTASWKENAFQLDTNFQQLILFSHCYSFQHKHILCVCAHVCVCVWCLSSCYTTLCSF